MAKDDRRKTFAAQESRNGDTNHDDDRRGRRQTAGLPIHKRTNNNGSRRSLRVEGIRDEPKPKLPKLRDHHEAIQGQLHAYKRKLASDLEHDLSQADTELHEKMHDLADTFDKKCSVIRDAGQVFRDHLAGEVLEVDDEKIMLDEHMEAFKELCEQKETKLRGLWKEYVEVQKQIMELALVVLDEDSVLVAASIAGEDGKLGEGQREAKDPELDESSVHERRGEFEQHQTDAVNALNGFEQTLDNVTSKALEKNKEIFDTFETGQKRMRDTIASFLDSVQEL